MPVAKMSNNQYSIDPFKLYPFVISAWTLVDLSRGVFHSLLKTSLFPKSLGFLHIENYLSVVEAHLLEL